MVGVLNCTKSSLDVD